MKRKIIGITSGFNYIDDDIFRDYKVTGVNENYVLVVSRAGALPLSIPTFDATETDIDEYINLIDMLIISGGEDISPEFYNNDRLSKLGRTNILRDKYEIALLKKAIEKNVPVFGVCRGMQLINSVFGGTLYQDLSYIKTPTIEHLQKERPEVGTQNITFDKNSFMGKYFPENTLINTFHHQAICKVADDFKVVAKANDGIIEAIEHKSLPIYGIQWHPEMMATKGNNLMQGFINYLIDSL